MQEDGGQSAGGTAGAGGGHTERDDDDDGGEEDPLYIKVLLRMLTGVDVNTRARPHIPSACPFYDLTGGALGRAGATPQATTRARPRCTRPYFADRGVPWIC
jgi:hypothetical protein